MHNQVWYLSLFWHMDSVNQTDSSLLRLLITRIRVRSNKLWKIEVFETSNFESSNYENLEVYEI